eukprot:CAMPEP_0197439426 /NCGR_PEP_ID=MMETSP1175-20131217/6179_1 /TAXON_ID=1003142 /ORGANISM="Triceratium dubium, Strain CCMP147" /LENGTH=132 /DNA_ID=CAMNT_0042969341 /DNA_START=180 /DNA_END=578 /DNA_ORIENTATION=+
MSSPLTDVEVMTEFYSFLYDGKDRTWDDAKQTFESYYHPDVVYDVGGGSELRYEQLMAFAKAAVEGNAIFEVDKIEDTEDGTYSSGWMVFPGKPKKYVQSVSKIEDGKFVHIRNVDDASTQAVRETVAEVVP